MGVQMGRCEGATAEKAVPFPCAARRSLLRHACVKRCKGQRESMRCGRKWRTIAPRRKSLLALQRLQNPRGLAANAKNLLRCIGRSRWARNLSTLHLQNRMSKGARHGHLSRRVSQTFRAEMERSEEHTSELQSLRHLVCRLL